MILVSIDPGLRQCGLAVFLDGQLVHCALPRNPEKKKRGAEAWNWMARMVHGEVVSWIQKNRGAVMHPVSLVVEVPQVYGGPRDEDPNDLIELAGVDGAIIGLLNPRDAVSYKPREWKGQTPKDTHNSRVSKKLTPEELKANNLQVVPNGRLLVTLQHEEIPDSLMHNVVDGVGLGLFELGRIGL